VDDEKLANLVGNVHGVLFKAGLRRDLEFCPTEYVNRQKIEQAKVDFAATTKTITEGGIWSRFGSPNILQPLLKELLDATAQIL